MPISSIRAGKTLGELSNWSMTNLGMQKILYFAHMFHLGCENKKPLIDEQETFEAWDYGPVLPKLYHRIKMFGNSSIPEAAFYMAGDIDTNGSEYGWLDLLYTSMKDEEPYKLVDMTHWEEGAWRKRYDTGIRNTPIPNDLILEEFHARKDNV